jgi:hypothetical protein
VTPAVVPTLGTLPVMQSPVLPLQTVFPPLDGQGLALVIGSLVPPPLALLSHTGEVAVLN